MTYGRSEHGKRTELLDLPPEIRNIIYEKIFKDLTVYWQEHIPEKADWTLDLKTPGASLMYTCRSISNEVRAMFYSHTTFSLQKMAEGQSLADATYEFCTHPPVEHARNLTALELTLSNLVCDQKIRPWEPQHIGLLEGNWKISKLIRLLDSKRLRRPIFPNLRRVRTIAPWILGFDRGLCERFFTACVKLSALSQLELVHERIRSDCRDLKLKEELAADVMGFYPLDGRLELKRRGSEGLILSLTR